MEDILKKENEKLKQKITHLSKRSIMNKMELELEIEILKRKRSLLNLLMPKIDMEDISACLTSFLFRVFPYDRAMIVFQNKEQSFLHISESEDQNFLMHKLIETDEEREFTEHLIDKIRKERKSLFINSSNISEYEECKKYMEGVTCMAVPILFMEDAICVCYLESKKEGSYSEKEVVEAEAITKTSAYAFLNSARNSKLCDLSFKDTQTGLYNKKYMKIILENQMVLSESSLEPFSLIQVKITGCKNKEKMCTEEKAMEYFREVIKTLAKKVRAVDMLFSLSEYRIVFLINNANTDIADLIKNRLNDFIEKTKIADMYIETEINSYTYTAGNLSTARELCEILAKY